MTTKIYPDYSAFYARTDKTENGVSKEFAGLNPTYEKSNETNKGCWNCSCCSRCYGCCRCYGCSDCSRCYDCSGCSRCSDCSGCYDKKGENWSTGRTHRGELFP